jgi:glycosyltransferase involved in cell wall biosynthesis
MLIAIDTVFYERPYSGISRVWDTYLKHNFFEGIDIILFVRQNSVIDKTILEKYHHIFINTFNYTNMTEDVNYLDKIVSSVNATHFISTYYTYCKIVPNIQMVYDMIPEVLNFPKNEMWIQKDLAIRNTKSYISISLNTKRDLLKYYPFIKEEQVGICNLTAEFIDKPLENLDKLLELGLHPKKYLFSVITNFEKYKNIDLIIQFTNKYLDDLPFLKYVVVTKVPIKFKNIINLNNIPDDLMALLYQQSLATVMPSIYEGVGYPQLEALNYNRPVIAIDNEINKEISDELLHYIDNNPESLCKKIIDIFETNPIVPQEKLKNFLDRFSTQTTKLELKKILDTFL